MAGQTLAEKILSHKAGLPVSPGDIVIVPVDLMVTHDANRPQAGDIFRELGGTRVANPERVKLVIDHAPAAHNASAAETHKEMRAFAAEFGVELIPEGTGIQHQVMPEKGYVSAGDVVIGSDSHTTTLGAFQAFASGVGSTDIAAAMMTSRTWLRVPESIHVDLTGTLSAGVYPKDIALELLRVLTADGATYQAVEFHGKGLQNVDISGRMTLANLAMEMGAKTGLFPFDEVLEAWYKEHPPLREPVKLTADVDATYSRRLTVDLSILEPSIAAPHRPDNVMKASDHVGVRIDQAFIGTCVNGRYDDLKVAADLLRGKQIAPNVRFLVTPASRDIYLQCLNDGIIEVLVLAGARIGMPGCTGCTGAAGAGVPANGDRVISAGNRNFQGRMGNRGAEIYLASPATVAASAITGTITDPRSLA